MAQITLHYFPVRGRGQFIRFIFHHQGIQFEQNIITIEQWFAQVKQSDLPQFSQLPMLDIDGHRMSQTAAIMNYLGKKYGYYSQDPYQAYLIDSIILYCEDFYAPLVPLILSGDKEGSLNLLKEKIQGFLGNLEKRLVSVNCGDGFFAGQKVTVADFYLFKIVHDWYYEGDKKEWSEEVFDQKAPKLKQWMFRVLDSSPTFKSYVEARGPDPMAP